MGLIAELLGCTVLAQELENKSNKSG